MSTLKSITLPLAQSRALVEKGLVLDTALSWYEFGYVAETMKSNEILEEILCPAPVLSELLDAIRASAIKKVCGMDSDETTIILSRNYAGGSMCGIRTMLGEYEVAQNPTDLLAAAALLMDVKP